MRAATRVGLVEHDVAQPKQMAAALGEGETRPAGERDPGRVESGAGLVAVEQGHLGEGLPVGGTHHGSPTRATRGLLETHERVMEGKGGAVRGCEGGHLG